MMLKISEIANEIRSEYLTAEEQGINTQLAQKLNRLLLEKGDLVECALGKIETKQGAEHGICGELRVKEDNSRYWQPLYSPAGREYVIELFKANRESLVVPAAEPAPTYRYSRTIRRTMQNHYPNAEMFLLEGPDRYWIYDEDAELLGNILHLRIRKTANGCNLTYRKQDHRNIRDVLDVYRISYVIIHPTTEEIVIVGAGRAPQGPNRPLENNTIRIGVGFSLKKDETGETNQYIILNGDTFPISVIDPVTGEMMIVYIPVMQLGNYTRISPETPMAQALLGAKVNDRIAVNGFRYIVTEIDNVDQYVLPNENSLR